MAEHIHRMVKLESQVRHLNEDFKAWWAIQRLKVGKLAALREYIKARRKASQDELIDGYQRYVQHKPDWQPWCHPRTFLSQGRWLDEYNSQLEPQPEPEDWYEECRRLHGNACGLSRHAHYTRKLIDAGKAER